MSRLVLALPDSAALGHRVSELAGLPLGLVHSRPFPDGETYLRIDADCSGKRVVIVCTLDHPDNKLAPLVFLADAARDLGASTVGLVAPYLAYMRQDRRFHPGEAVTSRTFASLLTRYVDWLVTIDPHLHRYPGLTAIYAIPNRVVHAAPALAAWIAKHVEYPILVGPDEESEQWVKDVAGRAGAPFIVMRKTRLGDRDVAISAPDLTACGTRTPVVVDDIVSSAHTMTETVKTLVAAGLRAPVCVAVHALFSGASERAIRDAGAARIVTTTSVPHATNAIDIMPLLIPAVHELSNGTQGTKRQPRAPL